MNYVDAIPTLLIFALVWLFLAFRFEQFPIGKATAALTGASLMVLFQILTPQEAFQSISGSTLLLLAGLMLFLHLFERRGLVHAFESMLLSLSPNALHLLVWVSLFSGFLGATIMNDGAAIFLSAVVVHLCEVNQLPLEPFAMAVATSANVGSAATIIGNPKNMIISEENPEMTFVAFAMRMVPVAGVAVLLNTAFLWLYYRKSIAQHGLWRKRRNKIEEHDDYPEDEISIEEVELGMHDPLLTEIPLVDSLSDGGHGDYAISEHIALEPLHLYRIVSTLPPSIPPPRTVADAVYAHSRLFVRRVELHMRKRTYLFVNLIYSSLFLLMYVGFLFKFDLGFTCIASAMLLLFLHMFFDHPKETVKQDSNSLLEEAIDWSLLVYLAGLCIVLEGVQKTPFPSDLWNLFAAGMRSSHPLFSAFLFGLASTMICLLFTSVPSVLIFAPHLREIHASQQTWYVLAWSVTICGNLLPFGSVTGLVVSEECRSSSMNKGRWIGQFQVWIPFALWSTLVLLFIGIGFIVMTVS